MINKSPMMRQPIPAAIPTSQTIAVRALTPTKPAILRPAKSWHRERRQRWIAATFVTLLVGGLVIWYGLHTQATAEAMRTARRAEQISMATKEGLRSGAILFVPVYGNICRQRWIDNATWTVQHGNEVVCDEAVNWNSTAPAQQNSISERIGAVRGSFAR